MVEAVVGAMSALMHAVPGVARATALSHIVSDVLSACMTLSPLIAGAEGLPPRATNWEDCEGMHSVDCIYAVLLPSWPRSIACMFDRLQLKQYCGCVLP